MIQPIEKIAILEALANKYRDMMRNAEKERADAQSEANSHVGAMESRYDTFKEEAQYLAQAHTMRVYELESGVQKLESLLTVVRSGGMQGDRRVKLASVVLIEGDDGKETLLFVAPFGGGEAMSIGGRSCRVITPSSPLGQAIMNRLEEDEIETPLGASKNGWIKTVM